MLAGGYFFSVLAAARAIAGMRLTTWCGEYGMRA